MNRQQIGHLLGQRITFTGKLEKFGYKYSNCRKITMLFKNVYIDDIHVDHMWLTDCRRLRIHDIRVGTVVKFNCVVQEYYKGFTVGEKRNVEIVNEGEDISLKEFNE